MEIVVFLFIFAHTKSLNSEQTLFPMEHARLTVRCLSAYFELQPPVQIINQESKCFHWPLPLQYCQLYDPSDGIGPMN